MTPLLTNWEVLVLCLAMGAAGSIAIGLLWSGWEAAAGTRLRLGTDGDDTTVCKKCGCGMVESAKGWACPECRNQVES